MLAAPHAEALQAGAADARLPRGAPGHRLGLAVRPFSGITSNILRMHIVSFLLVVTSKQEMQGTWTHGFLVGPLGIAWVWLFLFWLNTRGFRVRWLRSGCALLSLMLMCCGAAPGLGVCSLRCMQMHWTVSPASHSHAAAHA